MLDATKMIQQKWHGPQIYSDCMCRGISLIYWEVRVAVSFLFLLLLFPKRFLYPRWIQFGLFGENCQENWSEPITCSEKISWITTSISTASNNEEWPYNSRLTQLKIQAVVLQAKWTPSDYSNIKSYLGPINIPVPSVLILLRSRAREST